MNRLFLTLISFFILKLASSQTISPALTDEYCPDVEYTFTATITKVYQSMIGVGGCFVTQLPTQPVGSTFTFKGKFSDANQKQIFRIFYTDNTSYDFEFKKIKSLFYGACTPIQPNQTTVTAARCQIVNIPISFNNVQWKTQFENPALCFGSITTYEYQLPNGWSMNGQTSTGSNWIAGDNNETVTSDMTNGINGTIKVRPVNSCGSGLQPGEFSTILVSRPAPTVSISGPRAICVGGTGNYTLNGLPSGATVCWTISSSVATIPSSPYCANSVTVTQTGTGVATLTAIVSDCTGSYPPVDFVLALGTPVPEGILAPDHDLCNTGTRDSEIVWFYVINPISALTYYWQIDGMGAGVGNSVRVDAGRYDVGSHDIRVRSYSTECGYSGWFESYFIVADCSGYRFTISPNPVKDKVTIDGRKEKKSIKEVQVVDKLGNIKKVVKYSGDLQIVTLDVSALQADIYYIKIFDGYKWESKQLLKQ